MALANAVDAEEFDEMLEGSGRQSWMSRWSQTYS
jgi:hypothetical protein